MFHPFFDPSNMTVKELHDKIADVNSKIVKARLSGIDSSVLQHMYMVIASCNEEINMRQSQAELEQMKENSCVFDTEKYFGTEEETHESTKKSVYKRGW